MSSRLTARWTAALVLLLLLAASVRPVEAYVDPGSASYVFQLLVGAVLGGIFALRMYWDRVKTFVRAHLPGSRTIRE
jgi:hypothetical protein